MKEPSASPGDRLPLTYAVGRIGIDYGSESRRMSYLQAGLEPAAAERPSLLAVCHFLERSPWAAEDLLWTLNQAGRPIYVVRPRGPFAAEAFALLRRLLRKMTVEEVDQVSLPGRVSGEAMLENGTVVPVLAPNLRGVFAWGKDIHRRVADGPHEPGEESGARVQALVEPLFKTTQNAGRRSRDRAKNYVATDIFRSGGLLADAYRRRLEWVAFEIQVSSDAPVGADWWDFELTFRGPNVDGDRARRAYRGTVDVTEVVPAKISAIQVSQLE